MTRISLSLCALLAVGCASLSPRFSPEVAAAMARDDVHRLESENVELYYPGAERAQAVKTLERMEYCLEHLRSLTAGHKPRPKALVYLTSANFNNAYVSPTILGDPQHLVVPHHFTLDFFNWVTLGLTRPGDVTCHESVHYVQMEEIEGFWSVMNWIFGDVFSPNASIETWFLEGIATYYEGRLGRDVGRTHNPLWNAMFRSGIASRGGEIRAGDLSPSNRELLPFGGNYVAGMHFVDYLARRYGERKLWEVIDLQARSILSPFFVSLRFKAVYGKSLDALFSEYAVDLKREAAPHPRPAGQRVLDGNLGYLARLAVSRSDGAIASLGAGLDEPSRLVVRERDGRVRFSRQVTPILPFRPYIESNPLQMSGLSFSPDARRLFMVVSDLAPDGSETSRLLQLDATDGSLERVFDLGAAVGGSVRGARSYIFVRIEAQTANLASVDLDSGKIEWLTHMPEGTNLGSPEASPDGTRIAFARQEGDSFNLGLWHADGSVEALTHGGTLSYFPRWRDDRHLVFMHEVEDTFQAFGLDLDTRALSQISHAPFAAFDPVPDGERVLFVNRDGWGWSLDEIVLHGDGASSAPAAEERATSTDEGVAAIHLIDDRKASAVDHLFSPTLRVPVILPLVYNSAPNQLAVQAVLGASLQGNDRLSFHSYALNILWNTFDPAPSVSVGYGNYQLAPWFLSVSAQRAVAGNIADLRGTVTASRPVFTTPVSIGFDVIRRNYFSTATTPSDRLRLIGPRASFDYFAGTGTPYAGTRLGFELGASGGWYPPQLGSDISIADIRGQIAAYLPLPGLKRQTFRLLARAHALPGAPAGLLRVGGIPQGYTFDYGNVDSGAQPSVDLPGVSFSEALRGYEDFALYVSSAALVQARWRYTIPIDRGTISVLYVLPSFFVRQVDVDAFFDGAATDGTRLHRAAGAAAYLRTLFGSALPVSLFYQFAYRFDDGLRPLHLAGIAFQ